MNTTSGWIDRKLSMEWFEAIFIKEVREQHPEHRRVMLLLENAPSHPSATKLNASYDETVQVMFLPPNVTDLIQPMDQGVIEKVKRV